MTLRVARVTDAAAAAADGARPAALAVGASPVAGDDDDADCAAASLPAAGDHRNGTENGSKDESFFEAKPWLDCDSDDDFYSVRGDFTPSRNSTPDHPRLMTSFSGRMPVVDISKPSLIQKKQRLLELLQEKQHYDDDEDSVTDVSSELENGTVHDEEHMKTSRKGKKSNKSSRSGCFPSLFWKHSFTSSRKKRKGHKDKVN